MAGRSRQQSLDALIAALSDHYRRTIVAYMANSEQDRFSLDELAWELDDELDDHDDNPPDRSPGIEKYAHVALHHRHLPKLDDVGLIEYDAEARLVEYRGIPGCEIGAEIEEMESNTQFIV